MLHPLNRIKMFFAIPVRKMFCNAYIFSHLGYCCGIWGDVNNELINSVVKFQKMAARAILEEPIETPSSVLFSRLNWMTFSKSYPDVQN